MAEQLLPTYAVVTAHEIYRDLGVTLDKSEIQAQYQIPESFYRSLSIQARREFRVRAYKTKMAAID